MNVWRAIAGALCMVALYGCGDPPRVVQGTVVSYEPGDHRLLLLDEDLPNAEVTLSLAGAEVGADPSPKDLVRVAYHDRQGKLVALRVMNLTRQSELRKSSGGH
jgi:hypothetical protein